MTQAPRLDDPDFVSTLVFDPARGAATPKARFAHLFPTPRSAVIQVRLRPGLSDAQRRRAVALVRAAVAMPRWRLHDAAGYTVTGVPVLAEDLADALAGATLRLLVLAVVVMALVLAVAFRRRLRLLPLAVALAAVAITGGLDAPRRRAPDDGLDRGAAGAAGAGGRLRGAVPGARAGGAERDAVAARRAGPALCTAALATAAGFLVL